MRNLHLKGAIAALAITTLSFTSSMAAAQAVEQQPLPPPESPDQQQVSPTPPPSDVLQPQVAPQATQNPPPQPIPVPPVEGPGGGPHIDSTVLLGIGAVILGAGAYFLLHKKKSDSNGSGGGTTTTP